MESVDITADQTTKLRRGLRLNILLPLTLLLLIIVSIFIISSLRNEQAQTADDVKELHLVMQHFYDVTLKNEAKKLETALTLLKDNQMLQQAFLSRDRQSLLEHGTPIFQQLFSTGHVSHFYFHDIEQVNFLRLHQPERFGDTIERITLRDAKASGKPQSGIEMGPLGTFTLRVVLPWYQEQQLLGYLELGEEIGLLFNNTEGLHGTDFTITIDKKYLTREAWEHRAKRLPKAADWERLPTSVITYQSSAFPDTFFQAPLSNEGARVEFDDRFYQVVSLPLQDAGNRTIGQIFHLHDVTERVDSTRRSIYAVAQLTTILGVGVFTLFYVLTGRAEALLKASRSEITREGRQKEITQARHVQELEQEVSARQKAESVLAEQNASLKHLLTTSPAVIYTSHVDGDCAATFISDNVERMVGYKPQAFISDPAFWLSHIHPDDRENILSELSAVFDDQEHTMEYRFLDKEGNYRWVLDCMRLARDADNKPWELVGYWVDITERKHIEISNIRANRALKTLSECNMALVKSRETHIFQQSICDILVNSGGYEIAWIAYEQDDPPNTIKMVNHAGEQPDCLRHLHINHSDNEPVAVAIRTGQTQIIQNAKHNSELIECTAQLGYRSCIALPLANDERAYGAISIHASEPDAFDSAEVKLLEELAGDLAFGIQARRYRTERDSAQSALDNVLLETVDAIARTVEKRDPYTAGHQHRVSQLSVAIAEKMGLGDNRIVGLRLGGSIHDIGKIYIPAEILNRPGRLTEHEFGLIKTHSQVGYDIMEGVYFPWPVKEMILQHHERLDGSGYPQGLKGDEIIIEARIIAVADIVEAITSHRPYRPSLGIDKALEVIHEDAGIGLDKDVVNTCITLFKEGDFEWS
ncbi:HD domain-containing phosphohydrolase [Pseudomonadota bacterium]